MTIKNKVLASFGILLFLMFAMAGLGINRMTNMNKNLGSTYETMFSNVKLNQRLQNAVNELGRGMVTLLLNEQTLDVNQQVNNLTKTDQELRTIFLDIREKYDTPEQMQATEAVVDSGIRYLGYKDRIVGLVLEGNTDDAVRLRSQEGLKLQKEIQERTMEFSNYQEKRMEQFLQDNSDGSYRTLQLTIGLTLLGLLLVLVISYWVLHSLGKGLKSLSTLINRLSEGQVALVEGEAAIARDEIGDVVRLFNQLVLDLAEKQAVEQRYNKHNEEQAWLKSKVAGIMMRLQGSTDFTMVSDLFVRQTAPSVSAVYGGLYLAVEHSGRSMLKLTGSYAMYGAESERFYALGEGLIGQCALSNTPIQLQAADTGENLRVVLGSGELALGEILFLPIAYEDEVMAVLELGSAGTFTMLHKELLEQLAMLLGVLLHSIKGRLKVEELLRNSQLLTEELQSQSEELLSQQDELRTSYFKLEEQARTLQQSEELLQQQSEELATINEELTLQTTLLEEQVQATNEKRSQLEQANKVLEHQALELAVASKYKTEFLANMSHELRTPLNSMMILSRMLEENKEANLTTRQVEFASTIHSAGEDLLRLIDDVLDLSKVEAGRMEIQPRFVELDEIIHYVRRSFGPLSARKNVRLQIEEAEDLPKGLMTDPNRLMQIIGNLLSNAFKFTAEGTVTFRIGYDGRTWEFAVQDTGIGIPADQLEVIFQAFRQVNGTTSRNYGGTGLGLSISRQFSQLLGGHLTAASTEGKGSLFTLLIPELEEQLFLAFPGAGATTEQQPSAGHGMVDSTSPKQETLPGNSRDDAMSKLPLPWDGPAAVAAWREAAVSAEPEAAELSFTGSRILLVDDDIRNVFALSAVLEDCGMKVVFAENGHDAVEFVKQGEEVDLVLMDIMMPHMDGYDAMRAIRALPGKETLPIIALTAKAMTEDQIKCQEAGASDYLPKPIDLRRLLEMLQTWLST